MQLLKCELWTVLLSHWINGIAEIFIISCLRQGERPSGAVGKLLAEGVAVQVARPVHLVVPWQWGDETAGSGEPLIWGQSERKLR